MLQSFQTWEWALATALSVPGRRYEHMPYSRFPFKCEKFVCHRILKSWLFVTLLLLHQLWLLAIDNVPYHMISSSSSNPIKYSHSRISMHSSILNIFPHINEKHLDPFIRPSKSPVNTTLVEFKSSSISC